MKTKNLLYKILGVTMIAIVVLACGLPTIPFDSTLIGQTVTAAVMTAQADLPAATRTPVPTRIPAGNPPTNVPAAPKINSTPIAPNVNSNGQNNVNPNMTHVGGVGQFSISGAPVSVNKDVVLRATGADGNGNTFNNATGLGSEMILANYGSALYGPDEPASIVKGNPHGEYISPINQQMLGTETFATNTAEGAFTFATGAKMTVNVGDYTIVVESTGKSCSNNWFVMIRGLFPDGKQDSDLNTTTHFSDYVAGHTQVMWYPMGAYISEGNFLQVAAASHTGQRNCGAEGTSGLSVFMFDLNTGGYVVLYQANLNQPWQFVASNWR